MKYLILLMLSFPLYAADIQEDRSARLLELRAYDDPASLCRQTVAELRHDTIRLSQLSDIQQIEQLSQLIGWQNRIWNEHCR